MPGHDFDVLIVGSGFGGSVAALRLVEKGYRVGVLEAGRRFADADFAKTSWRLRDFLWAPQLGLTGIQRIHLLKGVVVLAGAGVGGGSLVYANTLYVPPPAFFDDPAWSDIADWATELAPYYDQAARMLGVTQNQTMTASDEVMKAVADDMGVGHTFTLTPVGVFFGDGPGIQSADPFFGGAGPERTGCIQCGACMTGCRHNAKNTLPKNYLALAENAGAVVFPMTTAVGIDERDGGGFVVEVARSGSFGNRRHRRFSAEHVVLAAGTYGTQRLLHRMKDERRLPRLSPRLGRLTRTNSESLLGAVATSASADYSRGVAITSSFYPRPDTHVEPVRYGKGSNSMGLLQSVLTVPRPGVRRWKTWARTMVDQRGDAARLLNLRRWSERSIISLVMQTVDNSLTLAGTTSRTGRWRLTTRVDSSSPAPTYIPVAQEVVKLAAARMGGVAAGSVFENVDMAVTAHFVGGCAIGATEATGVVDPYHRVFGHPGLHIVDGSTITANLGVNPSLTITAQAERAMAMWPNKGDNDLRPDLGSEYLSCPAVAPARPAVPAHASGALRIPADR